MIFHILVTTFFFGITLPVGVLSVMRGIYSFNGCPSPIVPSESAANVLVDEEHEQAHYPARPAPSRARETPRVCL
jgi:hypothetical protein